MCFFIKERMDMYVCKESLEYNELLTNQTKNNYHYDLTPDLIKN